MNEPAPDTATLALESHHGTRYTDEARELAYQLWAFKHGRNASSVAAAMQDEHPGLDERTVQRWAKDGDWVVKVRQDLTALAPAIQQAIITDLIAGAGEGAQHLRAVARGEAKAEPARVNACLGLLDRAGFGPRPAQPIAPEPERAAILSREEIRSMTPEEMRDAMEGRLKLVRDQDRGR